jgi:hypothetical protein
MPNEADQPASVSRTYRAALRLGEDYITLEETITLPLDADEQTIEQAVALGWRIYQAQHDALERQVAAIREERGPYTTGVTIRNPEAPASEKQRNLIASLQHDLSLSSDQLSAVAAEQQIDLMTLTKGQASAFIDELKRRSDAAAAAGTAPMLSSRQHQALTDLAQRQGVDLESVSQERFGVGADGLSSQQASTLIGELQRREGRG